MKTSRILPWLYLLPAGALILFFLVYPTANTFWLSFRDYESVQFVGLDNYRYVFTNEATRLAIRNNLLWMVAFPLLTVSLGFLLAVLVDRVRYEKILKAVIFLPMAISFVGAGVIWRFVYAFRPIQVGQIGLLNGVVVALGGKPLDWLSRGPWINNLALIAIGVWIWTGFCMTVFSAAYKNLPVEILEAARIDGADEWQLFWRITVPMMSSTISVVTVTMLVFALKVFDIIYITTNGLFDTEVL
ncbi:MAG TPA: sugar ABC transporter permease, partial [Anaerolineaceae bacterium]|nr:sugar ABC transporter permease [Anaerolineaceae bacterium]